MLPPAGWRSPLHYYNPVLPFPGSSSVELLSPSSIPSFQTKKKRLSVPKLSLCVEMGTNRKMWITTTIRRRRALMTDQGDRPLTPLSSLEQLSSKDSRGNRSTWVDQMDRKAPVHTRPFPIVGIYGHVVLFQLSCWLLRLIRLHFSISLYCFYSALVSHACLLSVSIINISLHIFRCFAVITPLSWQ